jgi:hypothetical protein
MWRRDEGIDEGVAIILQNKDQALFIFISVSS